MGNKTLDGYSIVSSDCLGSTTGTCLSEKELGMNYGIFAPMSISDVVVVGKVIDVKQISDEDKSEYSVQVEKYLKNQKPFDLIVATGKGIAPKTFTEFNEVLFYNEPVFEKDDRVFLYLKMQGGNYEIIPYSFAISKRLPAGGPPDLVTFFPFKNEYYSNEKIIISGIIKKGYVYLSTAEYSADPSVYIRVLNSNQQQLLSDRIQVEPDGSFSYGFRINGVNGTSGGYEFNFQIGHASVGSTFVYFASPLKQFKDGIPIEEIKCKEDYVFVIKTSNGNPACVKQSTLEKLYLRGWGDCGWNCSHPVPENLIDNEPTSFTKTQISFGTIEGRKILPITITEITTNPESLDEITKWGFSQLNITMANLGKTWGNLPEQYTSFDIVDESDNNVLDKTRLPEGLIFYPADQHLYPAICDNDIKIIGKSHHPINIPINRQAKIIFMKSTSNGIYPDENGLYRIDYFSIFETKIKFPENADIISHETKICKLEKQIEEDPEGQYAHGYYIKAIFRLDN